MVFASSLFIFLFLPLTLAGYFLIPTGLRNAFLVAASLIFYAWGEPVYIALLIGLILLNYAGALVIDRQRHAQTQVLSDKSVLAICVAGNLELLFFLKYANFFIDNLNRLFFQLALPLIPQAPIHLPLGISFFTFHAISYIVDVYRKETQPQPNVIDCALYFALFTQLIAGPIIRYRDVAQQIIMRAASGRQFSSGIRRFVYGLTKKVVLANPLGNVADQVFLLSSNDLGTSTAWLGLVCYTLQIYFDFSGYSDMAIGLARMFGFEFLENFNYPYIAQSVREFWQRWHISLSNWLRDYLYLPLGGSRVSARRTYVNLWIVFLLGGFWHGASWSFIVWGGWYGAWLVIERLGWQSILGRLWRPLRHVYTLSIVMVGWVFFRAESLTQAIRYLISLIGLGHSDGIRYAASFYLDPRTVLTLLLGVVFATPIARWVSRRILEPINPPQIILWQRMVCVGEYLALVLLFLLSAAYLSAGTYNPFIYFRF